MSRTSSVNRAAASPSVDTLADDRSATTEPSAPAAAPRRTLGELIGMQVDAPPGAVPHRGAAARDTASRDTAGRSQGLASKLKGKAQRFIQKHLVSTTASEVVVANTRTGWPSTRPARGNARAEASTPAAPDTPAPDAPSPALRSDQERRVGRVLKHTFDPAASPAVTVRNDVKRLLGASEAHNDARLDAMHTADGFDRWMTSRFGTGDAAQVLRAALEQPFAVHGAAEAHGVGALPFARQALLADALAQATGAEPQRTLAALTALQHGAFLPQSALPTDETADVFHNALDELEDVFEDASDDPSILDAQPTSPAASTAASLSWN